MKRTRTNTIDENPLDAKAKPPPSAKAAKIEQAGEGKTRNENPVQTKKLAVVSTPSNASSTRSSSMNWKDKLPRFKSSEIAVLSGDVKPQTTQLSFDKEGRRGFHLVEDEFVAIKRDVASITICVGAAGAGVSSLLAWGALGAFVAGPVGALAGGLLGGRKMHRVTAQLHLNDGRTLTIAADMSIIERMRAGYR